MSNIELQNILHEVLGPFEFKSNNNISFKCPFCNHHKSKLEISLENYNWHCWVCHAKGKTFRTLIKKLALTDDNKRHYLKLITNITKEVINYDITTDIFNANEESQLILCNLPDEYIPLWKSNNSLDYKTCMQYLKDRNITYNDILKYRLGYCESGLYKNMIIIPNYNKSGKLNYFTTRSYLRNSNKKFINPPFSRDVIGFELQINPKQPIIIVESALDAIIIKRNAIPLYGTNILAKLKEWILDNEIKLIYVCLDEDVYLQSLHIIEYFLSIGINIKHVKLPKNEDANSLGYDKIWEYINQSEYINNTDNFESKIKFLLQ